MTLMNTKEKIIDEALTLFSKKGYSGVTVREIAAAVGIKDSSLYKHFTSKKQIFDTILKSAGERMDKLTDDLNIADATKGDASKYFRDLGEDGIVELSKKVFLFYLKDNFVSRFRRMLTIEQYKNSEVSELYVNIFTDKSITYQTLVFSQLIDCGFFKKADPEITALEYYSPIFLLMTLYDNKPEKEEEALARLEKYVRHFAKVHTNSEN